METRTASDWKTVGNSHFEGRRWREAADAYTQAIEADPTYHVAFSNRSAAYLKVGGSEELALADAHKCVELSPQWAKGHSRKVAALMALKRFDDAVEACTAAIAVADPESRDELEKRRRECRCHACSVKLRGKWHGKVTQELGDYVQEFDFIDGKEVRVGLMGKSYPGSFNLDMDHDPWHLNLQVIPPDAPPGFTPPPVPYIARFVDENTLLTCCPYMTTERPTSFEGAGVCELRRGALVQKVDEAIAKLSEEDQLMMCVQEALRVIPDTKLEDLSGGDSDEIMSTKLMVHVKFQSDFHNMGNKYGEETLTKVITAAHSNADLPGAYGDAIRKLHLKMDAAGLFNPPQAGETANQNGGGAKGVGSTSSETSKKAPAEAPPLNGKEETENVSQDATQTDGQVADVSVLVGAAIIVALSGAALIYGFWRSRRR
mmetsp:Transcript_42858/g.118490  ORF Transcript_42858/g.118490 Transcript_42858/m.118490 type:complete len:431 (+) Transcript_42858:131-1423(+)